MSHRLDTIPLPADKARCPGAHCERKMTCARYLAAIPKQGATMNDFSINSIWCMAYISLQSLKDSAKIKPAAPAPKEWIGNA